MTTDPERTLTMTDNTTPQPVSDTDREAKYADALGRGLGCCDGTDCDECLGGAVAVMAVADAEIEATTKSLRAENERLRERFNDYRERFNGYLDEAAVRAEAAEAEAKGLAEHLGREIQRTSRVRALYRGDSENNRHAYCIRPADLLRALDGA